MFGEEIYTEYVELKIIKENGTKEILPFHT
jgi:hypothetical protein